MKKETIKEFGKLSFDAAKILLAIGIVTPFFKREIFSFAILGIASLLVIILIVIGGLLYNRGAKDNE